MISIKNVCVKFTKEYYALYDISFDVEKGETIALLGERQSGKTTLLRTLAKLEKIDSGEVYIKSIPLNKVDFSLDVNVGYIPHTPVFKKKKTVYENLRYILKFRKHKQNEIENLINEALINFNIEVLKDTKIENLSLFEKYLVSIARLSFRNLDVVFIDNIFDELAEEEIVKLLEFIKKEFISKKITTLVATTSEDIAKKVSKRIIKFNGGSIEGE